MPRSSPALILTALVTALPHAQAAEPTKEGDAPVKVFAALDGRWGGEFVGYDPAGKELYRIRVQQTYETIDAHTQKVRILDTNLATGETITGEGENTAHRAKDGSLTLRCVVRKSNGERVEHQGRLVRGAEGDLQLVWYSVAPDRSETFREVVSANEEPSLYTIDGMGRYGSTLVLMHGRYRRITPPRSE